MNASAFSLCPCLGTRKQSREECCLQTVIDTLCCCDRTSMKRGSSTQRYTSRCCDADLPGRVYDSCADTLCFCKRKISPPTKPTKPAKLPLMPGNQPPAQMPEADGVQDFHRRRRRSSKHTIFAC